MTQDSMLQTWITHAKNPLPDRWKPIWEKALQNPNVMTRRPEDEAQFINTHLEDVCSTAISWGVTENDFDDKGNPVTDKGAALQLYAEGNITEGRKMVKPHWHELRWDLIKTALKGAALLRSIDEAPDRLGPAPGRH